MATASLVALVASLAMAAPAAPDAIQPIDTWQSVSEINCEVHGQGFYTAVPRAPAKQRRPVSTAADVPVWKTIGIGTYDSNRALREALRRKRCRVGEQAQAALDQLAPVKATRTQLKLSVLTLAELGFDSAGAALGQVYARAAKLGFELCPAEAGPQLRLQYMNQKLGEFLHIAMEPVVTAGGAPVIFVVANGGEGLALLSSDGHSGTVMPAASRFVFIKPQAVAMR